MAEEREFLPRAKEKLKQPEKERQLLPIKKVAKMVELSGHRIRRLLNTGKVEGKKVRRKSGKGYPFIWKTTAEEVKRYRESLLSPREYGKRGGRPKKAAEAV